MDIKGKYDGENISLTNECTEGKHGKNTEEVKVDFLTVQNTPKALSPNFTLVGRVQTTNDSNDFDKFSVNVYIEA